MPDGCFTRLASSVMCAGRRHKRAVDVVHQQARAVLHRPHRVAAPTAATPLRRRLLAGLIGRQQSLRLANAVTVNPLSRLRKKGSTVVCGGKLGRTLSMCCLTCSSVLRLAACPMVSCPLTYWSSMQAQIIPLPFQLPLSSACRCIFALKPSYLWQRL